MADSRLTCPSCGGTKSIAAKRCRACYLKDVQDSPHTRAWEDKFFDHLRASANVSDSAEKAGIARSAVYQARADYPDFADRWDEAVEIATDSLEMEARRRALEGVQEPVYFKGEVVGHVQRYSDSLIQFLLRAHRPRKYRENVELTGPGGGPIQVRTLVDVVKEMAAEEDDGQ